MFDIALKSNFHKSMTFGFQIENPHKCFQQIPRTHQFIKILH